MTGPSYPMGPLGPDPGPPSLRGPQTAHALGAPSAWRAQGPEAR